MSSQRGRHSRLQDVIIGGRFRIDSRLGGGAFGEVFKGVDVTNGKLVAIKMELSTEGHHSHLGFEHKIYKRFNECPTTVGVLRSYYCGRCGDYTVLVMDLLGPCLEDLFNACKRTFQSKTVCMLGVQLIQRMQYLHTVGYLHRDIKPENFVMGLRDQSHVVYAIDVGLSRAWRDSHGRHIAYAENKSLTGTARYVSINTHKGIQQSRRDDLESVSYLLLYFARGSLPWQGLKSPKNDFHYSRIREVKQATSPETLAQGHPPQLGELVRYTRSLEFEEEPNYLYCVNLMLSALNDMGAPYDYRFEWNVLQEPTSTVDFDELTDATAMAMGGSSLVASSNRNGDTDMPSLMLSQFDAYGLDSFY